MSKSAGDANLAAGFARDIAQRLEPCDIAGEGGHHHPLARMALHFLEQALVDRPFRTARRGIEDIGAVADHGEDTFLTRPYQGRFVGGGADLRVRVQLPVAGMHDGAGGAADDQRIRFRN